MRSVIGAEVGKQHKLDSPTWLGLGRRVLTGKCMLLCKLCNWTQRDKQREESERQTNKQTNRRMDGRTENANDS